MIYSRCNRAVMAAITCALATSVMTPKSAFAQAATETAPHADDGLQEVVVTGSFIKRPADRPQPLTVLSSEDLNDSQRNSVAESLKDLPQNVGVDGHRQYPGWGCRCRQLADDHGKSARAGGRRHAGAAERRAPDCRRRLWLRRRQQPRTVDHDRSRRDADRRFLGAVWRRCGRWCRELHHQEEFFRLRGGKRICSASRIRLTTGPIRMSVCSGAVTARPPAIVAGLEYQTTEVLLTDDRYSADRLKYALTSGFGQPGDIPIPGRWRHAAFSGSGFDSRSTVRQPAAREWWPQWPGEWRGQHDR